MRRSPFLLLALLLAAPGLSGCVAIGAYAIAETAITLNQDRTVGQTFDDQATESLVRRRFAARSLTLFNDALINVHNSRVLLTGHVPNEQLKADAEAAAAEVKGVRAIYNELQVGDGRAFGARTDDTVIRSKLRAALITDWDVKDNNYQIRSIDGTVYLLGIARSEAERDAVIESARGISGVTLVVDYIEIAPDLQYTAEASGS